MAVSVPAPLQVVCFGPAILRQLERTPPAFDPRGWQQDQQKYITPPCVGAAWAALHECRCAGQDRLCGDPGGA
jgi:hypothetical protein